MNEADMDERELVVAARQGDRTAQDTLVRRLLPLVHNVVGRALSCRPDVDRVAQEAMLKVMRDLPGPNAAHDLRTEATRTALRTAAQPPTAPVGAEESPVDFEELACLRPQLPEQYRELVQASRWLDPHHRIVWSLWWLEATGEMTRTDIAHVLATTAADTDARVHGMLGQLKTGRDVVAALTVSRCEELTRCTAGWDGRPDATWRRHLADHVQQCADCFALTLGQATPQVLLADDTLVPVPSSLADAVTVALREQRQDETAPRHRAARARRKGAGRTAVCAAVVIAALAFAYTVVPTDGAAPTGRSADAVAASSARPPSAQDSATATPSPSRTSTTPQPSRKAQKKTTPQASAASAGRAPAQGRAGCGNALASRWADWPMPDARTSGAAHPASYTNAGDGTVRDNVTCLLWQRAPAPRTYTFTDAQAYCTGLDLNGGGWRLPTRVEVMSLVDTTRSGPAIDTAAFPGTPARFFWTSTPWAVTKTPLRAWIVNFYEGLSSNAAHQSGAYQVRCVRGGSGSGRPAYQTSGGQITDPATGLTWQRATASRTMTATAGDAYCAALTLGGRTWRLPTVKELATLVDDGRVTPAIDRTAFPDTPGTGTYWSASTFAPDPSQRWFLSHNDGITSHRPLDGAYVRCVARS